MVEVHIREDGRSRPSSFFVTGHAGWADAGDDIVCAAVSTLLQSAWLGLAEVAHVDVRGERSDGELRLGWPAQSRDDARVQAIVATAVLSLERLAHQYPDHVRTIRETDDG